MFRSAMQRAKRTVIRSVAGGALVLGTLEWTTHLPSQGRSSQVYHSVADDWVTPLLRRLLNPELAHHAAIMSAKRGLAPTVRLSAKERRCRVSQTLFSQGLVFRNPVGLAAGFDKDGEVIQEMIDLGFGFVEIGTVTPKAQPGNPKPRMFRLPESLGIINRYGFNSEGADAVELNVWKFRHPEATAETVQEVKESYAQLVYRWLVSPAITSPHQSGLLGINIGKNKESTDAVADYVSNIRQLSSLADYIVINISSPNTQGLRDLQQADSLQSLLEHCIQARNAHTKQVPLLVKVAPDLSSDELLDVAKVCQQVQIDGIVVTNTTNQRPSDLFGAHRAEGGGLSGKPVRARSTECIRLLYAATDGKIPIIGVGGIGNGHDAYEKLKAGASLVQIYSMMVYQGPGVVSRIRDELAKLMLENGQRSIQDVIGADHEEIFWRDRMERSERERRQESQLMVTDQSDSSGSAEKGEVTS